MTNAGQSCINVRTLQHTEPVCSTFSLNWYVVTPLSLFLLSANRRFDYGNSARDTDNIQQSSEGVSSEDKRPHH